MELHLCDGQSDMVISRDAHTSKKFGQVLFCLPYLPTQKVWTFRNQNLLFFKFSSFRQKFNQSQFLEAIPNQNDRHNMCFFIP